MDNSHIFRPIIAQVPGQPDPTSGDGLDFAAGLIQPEPTQPSYATHGLPDPNITGPCQLQSSPFCEGAGVQRMDPMDMLETETAFRGYVQACQTCYDANATRFVAESHGRI